MSGLLLAVAFFAGVVAVGALTVAWSARKTADRVRLAPLVRCADVPFGSGTVRLQGWAEPPQPGSAPRAPLSGQPYAWC